MSVIESVFETVARFMPDTVLLDIGMPGMDGYEVARRIRLRPDCADVMLVALTGWGQDHDYRLSRGAGFDHHLVKPPHIDELRDALTFPASPRTAARAAQHSSPSHT